MSPRMGINLETILQESIKIADESGIHAVTIASLAKRLNIRPPSLYNHIEGLAEIRKKLAIHGLEELHDKMTKEATSKSGDEAVLALGVAYVAFVRLHPGLYEAILLSSDNQDVEVMHAGEKVVTIVLEGLQHYNLKEPDSIHAVRTLRSILHGFASLEQMSGFNIPIDLDESLNYAIKIFLLGIRGDS